MSLNNKVLCAVGGAICYAFGYQEVKKYRTFQKVDVKLLTDINELSRVSSKIANNESPNKSYISVVNSFLPVNPAQYDGVKMLKFTNSAIEKHLRHRMAWLNWQCQNSTTLNAINVNCRAKDTLNHGKSKDYHFSSTYTYNAESLEVIPIVIMKMTIQK